MSALASPRRRYDEIAVAIIEGKVAATWPTFWHAPLARPVTIPVRVSQGVTADDPDRWLRLAWTRYLHLTELIEYRSVQTETDRVRVHSWKLDRLVLSRAIKCVIDCADCAVLVNEV